MSSAFVHRFVASRQWTRIDEAKKRAYESGDDAYRVFRKMLQ